MEAQINGWQIHVMKKNKDDCDTVMRTEREGEHEADERREGTALAWKENLNGVPGSSAGPFRHERTRSLRNKKQPRTQNQYGFTSTTTKTDT